MQAIDVLLSHGVQEEKILFLNLVSSRLRSGSAVLVMGLMMDRCCWQISSPEGLKNTCEKYPKLKIVSRLWTCRADFLVVTNYEDDMIRRSLHGWMKVWTATRSSYQVLETLVIGKSDRVILKPEDKNAEAFKSGRYFL